MTPVAAKMPAASKKLRLENGRNGITAQSRTTGAAITVPAASASHQVAQVAIGAAGGAPLARNKPAAAMVELSSAVGTNEMIANLMTSNGAANVWRPFDQRPISQAPAIAASSVPIAIEPESTM